MYWSFLYQAKVEMNQRLDEENYSDDETVTFKIPLVVPYQVEGAAYERTNGEFEYNGEFFKLVKQKLERDTLFVVCIKDHKEKKLFNAMIDFVKLSVDLPASSQQTLKLLGSFIKDFVSGPDLGTQENHGWSLTVAYRQHLPVNLLFNDLPVVSPPPDFKV